MTTLRTEIYYTLCLLQVWNPGQLMMSEILDFFWTKKSRYRSSWGGATN